MTRRRRETQIVAIFLAFSLWLSLYLFFGLDADSGTEWQVYPERPRLLEPTDIFEEDPEYLSRPHPIDDLIQKSRADFQRLLDRPRGDTLAKSVALYRERRGRHPPPGYDKWYAFAKERDAVMIEDMFDRIYRDIEPFWGMEAARIRATAKSTYMVKIRNGELLMEGFGSVQIQRFVDMFDHVAEYLPDVDIPLNHMDEPRISAAWEDIHELLRTAEKRKDMSSPPTIYEFGPVEETNDTSEAHFEHTGPLWDIVRRGCDPETPGRWIPSETDYSSPPIFPSAWPNHTHQGYVSNWTLAKSPCHHTTVPSTHGTFVNPLSISMSQELVPMFGHCKLPMNNDILLPATMHWIEDNAFTAPETFFPWEEKRNEVFWRGSASGGRNTPTNWKHFHRHRLISMLNQTHMRWALDEATHLTHSDPGKDSPRALPRSNGVQEPLHDGETKINTTALSTSPSPLSQSLHNVPIPDTKLYPLIAQAKGLLPDWIHTLSNAAFTFLQCHPWNEGWDCPYTDSYYRQGINVQFPLTFQARYLPDVDGNSYSGRYRAFLLSDSVPLKATVYDEWFDDRLFAWQHFVPLDNSFVDLYAVLEYFFARDKEARRIADEGRRWGRLVLRREDILIYLFRLVLEFKRVSSEDRERMGWHEDGKG